AIPRPACRRPQKEKLFERKFTLKNISFGQTGLALDIQRRDELFADDDVLYIWRVLGDGVDHGVAEGFALLVPISAAQFVRRVLHEAGKNVFSRRRDGRIGKSGDYHINVGAPRKFAI